MLLMEDFDKVALTILQQNRDNLDIKKGHLAKISLQEIKFEVTAISLCKIAYITLCRSICDVIYQ